MLTLIKQIIGAPLPDVKNPLRRNILIFIIACGFRELRFFAPMAILYFAKITGTYSLGMMVFSIITVSVFVFEIPTGMFSDKIGRRTTSLMGSFAAVIAVLFYALAHSTAVLIAGAVIDGLSRALHNGNEDALLYDTLLEANHEEAYSRVLAKSVSLSQTCGIISAIVGGIFGEWSLRILVWLSLIPMIARFIVMLWLLEPSSRHKNQNGPLAHLKESFAKSLGNARTGSLILGSTLIYGMEEACWYFRAAFIGTLWSIFGVGISRVIARANGALGAAITGGLINKFGAIKVLICGTLFGRLLGFVSVVMPTVVSPVLLGITNGAYSSNLVAKQVLLQAEFTSSERATMGSIESLLGNFIFAICSTLVGFLADKYGPGIAIGVFQIAQLGVVGLFWIHCRLAKEKNVTNWKGALVEATPH